MDIFSLLVLRILGKRNHTFNNCIFGWSFQNMLWCDVCWRRIWFPLSYFFFFSKFTTTAICRALFMTGLIDLPYSKPSRLSQWLVLPCYSEPEWVKGTELEPVVKYVGVCTLKRSADKECWTPKAVSGHFDAGDSLSWDFSTKRYHFSSLWSPPRRSGHRRRAFSSCHFSEMKNLQAEFQQVWNRHKGTAVT